MGGGGKGGFYLAGGWEGGEAFYIGVKNSRFF